MNDATLITLRNNAGLTLELMDLGAAVRSLAPSWSTSGTADVSSVVLGHPQISDYHQTPKSYLGAIVGRYANRIAGGTLPIDGRVHQLKTNEGPNTLHGGPDGFDTRRWEVMQRTPTSATFQLHSPDGDQGFPGAVTATATYRITTTDHGAADVIDIILTATSDAPTMVNLASHPYFRLAPLGSASDDHLLQVNAERYLPINGDGIPNGTPRPVEGTPLDLRRPRRLGDILRHPHAQIGNAGGLDHCYLLNDDPTSDEGLRFAATLTHPASLLRLDILTDQPGLQVYSANAFNGTQHDQLSRRLRQGDAIALEAQGFPDAPNQPHLGPVVLRQGETYRSHTQWRVCSYERTVAPRSGRRQMPPFRPSAFDAGEGGYARPTSLPP